MRQGLAERHDENRLLDSRNRRITVKYKVIIDWSAEDKAFIAAVPELPGCMADGKTPAAALKAAQRVMKDWVETAKKLGRPSGRWPLTRWWIAGTMAG